MNQKEATLELAMKNSGVLLTKQVSQAGIPRTVLKQLVDSNKLSLIQRGVYVTKNGFVDDFFLLQQKYSKGVYSHETALFLLGFSDRTPTKITMTFKHGYSTGQVKKENIHPVTISKNYDIGVSEIIRNGEKIKVYNIERTLVDLLKPRYDLDYEQLIPALKKYAAYEKRDVNKLFKYARIFKVEEKIRNYMMVLLWRLKTQWVLKKE